MNTKSGYKENWQPKPDEADLFCNLYIDESSQTKFRYLVIGGLVVPQSHAQLFESDVIAARENSGFPAKDPDGTVHVMKWQKVKNHNFRAYRDVIDTVKTFVYRHNLPASKKMGMRCVVVDTSVKSLRQTGDGDEDIGYHKELYFLCTIPIAQWCRTQLFHVYPDRRETSRSLKFARDVMNKGVRKYADLRVWPFRRLWFQEPEDWQGLQVVDILIGALAYRVNRHYDKPDANFAKRKLCDHIWERFNLPDPFNTSPPQQPRFAMWLHRPRPENAPRFGPQNFWR